MKKNRLANQLGLFVFFGFFFSLLVSPILAVSTSYNTSFPTIDFNNSTMVNSTAYEGTSMYLGGKFSYIGPRNTGFSGVFSTSTSDTVGTYARVNNTVTEVISDGSNGWYIAGYFTQVGAVSQSYLAHINSDGSLDTNFLPTLSARPLKLALSSDGTKLYVGGFFTTVNSVTRNYLAVLNTSDGSLDTGFNASITSGYSSPAVYGLMLSSDGNTLYVGGKFNSVGGQTRVGIAAVNPSTGAVLAWYPSGGINYNTSGATQVDFTTDGTYLYVWGIFNLVQGSSWSGMARINIATATHDTSFTVSNNGTVSKAEVSGGILYLSGYFTSVKSTARAGFAAIDVSDGSLTSLNLGLLTHSIISSRSVRDFEINGNTLYIGGVFLTPGGVRPVMTAYDLNTSSFTSWNPGVNGAVEAFALSADKSKVYIGGNFTSAGGDYINSLAKVNSDGSVDDTFNFDMPMGSIVNKLQIIGDYLYVSGYFTSIDGQSMDHLVRINVDTGVLDTSWVPNPDDQVIDFTLNGTTMYLGGNFYTLGADSREQIGAIDVCTAEATSWNPTGFDSTIKNVVLNSDASVLFVSGEFSAPQNYITALKTTASAAPACNLTATPLDESFEGTNPPSGWSVGGNVAFAESTTEFQDGLKSMASGTIGNSQISSLDTTVTMTNPGKLTFYWKVSSATFDNLIFCLNNTGCTRNEGDLTISGIRDWEQATINLPPGTSTLTWKYAKNSSGVAGSDKGWVDNVVVEEYDNALLCLGDSYRIGWNPNATSYVEDMLLSPDGSTLFVGGYFDNIGFGGNREYLAGFDTTSYVTKAFNATPSNYVESLDISADGTSLYVGGWFTTIGGSSRRSLAELNSTSGTASSWNPITSTNIGVVWNMDIEGNNAFASSEILSVAAPEEFNPLLLYGSIPTGVTNPSHPVCSGGSTPTPTPTTGSTPTNTPTPTPSSSSGSTQSSSSTSSDSTTVTVTTCSDTQPSSAPDLFQLKSAAEYVTLFFSPVSPVSTYSVEYGNTSEANTYGVNFNGTSKGVQKYTIYGLSPGKTYYFRVKGVNGCKAGEWSAVKSVQTDDIEELPAESATLVSKEKKNKPSEPTPSPTMGATAGIPVVEGVSSSSTRDSITLEITYDKPSQGKVKYKEKDNKNGNNGQKKATPTITQSLSPTDITTPTSVITASIVATLPPTATTTPSTVPSSTPTQSPTSTATIAPTEAVAETTVTGPDDEGWMEITTEEYSEELVVVIENLEENTQYEYVVTGTDFNNVTSEEVSQIAFTTGTDDGHLLEPVEVIVEHKEVIVRWNTDVDTTGILKYGSSEQLGEEIRLDTLSTQHEVILRGLPPKSTYYYQIESAGPSIVRSLMGAFVTGVYAEEDETASITGLKEELESQSIANRVKTVSQSPLFASTLLVMLSLSIQNFLTKIRRIVFVGSRVSPIKYPPLILSVFSKRKRPWGVVFDTVNGLPQEMVLVILRNEKKQQLHALTDKNGQYDFDVPEGWYSMTPSTLGYSFPPSEMKQTMQGYKRVYGGEEFQVQNGEIPIYNIPIEPDDKKRSMNQQKKETHIIAPLSKIQNSVFYLGFLWSIIAFLSFVSWYNGMVFLLYILFFGARTITKR